MSTPPIPPIPSVPPAAQTTKSNLQKLTRKLLKRALIILPICYCLWLIVLYFAQASMIFPASFAGKPDLDSAITQNRGTIETIAGTRTVIIPPSHATTTPNPTPNSAIIIAFHGNAETAEQHALYGPISRAPLAGFWLITPEYPGYGHQPGSPSQAGINANMKALADALAQDPRFKDKPTIYVGTSLGGGVATDLARSHPPTQALILLSTFTSIPDIARSMLAPGFIVKHPFDNRAALPKLNIPITLIHGTSDTIIPHFHSQRLAQILTDAGKPPTFTSFDGDHFYASSLDKKRVLDAVIAKVNPAQTEQPRPSQLPAQLPMP